MIICPEKRFVFVHIPKCAGSSVRSQVKLCDRSHVSMGDVGFHPILGNIDYGHIPLSTLREHFPQEYASVRDMAAFAVVRDPFDRVGSSLRQVIWREDKRPMSAYSQSELRDKTQRILDRARNEIDLPSTKLVFFARQKPFIYDGDTRLVDHVLPMFLVPDFIAYLGRRCGVPLDAGARANQNIDLKFKTAAGPAYAVNSVLRRVLPGRWHSRIKETALSVLTSGKNAAETSGVLDMPEVRDFVERYYAEDVAFYRDVLAVAPEMRQSMRHDGLSPAPA